MQNQNLKEAFYNQFHEKLKPGYPPTTNDIWDWIETNCLTGENGKEALLTTIFNELENKAYNPEYHNYYYKQANQVIRKCITDHC